MIKEINSVELNLALTKWFKNRLIDNKAVENGDFFLFSAAACNGTCRNVF